MTGVLHSDDGFPQLVFRFVAAFGPSVRIGPSIILGSALTYQSLFFFRACVCTRPPFLTGSPIRTRPLLIIAHGDISTGCRESCCIGRNYRGLCASDSWPRRAQKRSIKDSLCQNSIANYLQGGHPGPPRSNWRSRPACGQLLLDLRRDDQRPISSACRSIRRVGNGQPTSRARVRTSIVARRSAAAAGMTDAPCTTNPLSRSSSPFVQGKFLESIGIPVMSARRAGWPALSDFIGSTATVDIMVRGGDRGR
jgi:hypothetical protein